MKYFILPYKRASKSAKLLACALNRKRIRQDPFSRFRHTNTKLVINWGKAVPHTRVNLRERVLNKWSAVKDASNKIATLNILKQAGVPHVEFTSSISVANDWISAGHTVFARALVSASCGHGITVHTVHDLPDVPLYTKQFKKKKEYRVHVFNGTVIDITQKRKRHGIEVNRQVRSHDNGWVFCHHDIHPLSIEHQQVAIRGVQSLGLDFGAVDLLVRDDDCVICEVNTAPGIEGITLEKYVAAFQNYLLEH